LQIASADVISMRYLKTTLLLGVIYPAASWLIILCYGFSTRYVDLLSANTFICGHSFIAREFYYVVDRWPWMEAQKGTFVLFEYLFIGFIAIAIVKALLNVFFLRLFDLPYGKLFGPDPLGGRGSLFSKQTPLVTTPFLFGFNLLLLTHIQEQMKVDLLRNWIQHSVAECVAMQMFVLSVSIAMLIDLITIFIWRLSRFEHVPA